LNRRRKGGGEKQRKKKKKKRKCEGKNLSPDTDTSVRKKSFNEEPNLGGDGCSRNKENKEEKGKQDRIKNRQP